MQSHRRRKLVRRPLERERGIDVLRGKRFDLVDDEAGDVDAQKPSQPRHGEQGGRREREERERDEDEPFHSRPILLA